MTCHACGRNHSTAALSLEFDTILCDPCHATELNTKRANREKATSLTTAAYFEDIRNARDMAVQVGLGRN